MRKPTVSKYRSGWFRPRRAERTFVFSFLAIKGEQRNLVQLGEAFDTGDKALRHSLETF